MCIYFLCLIVYLYVANIWCRYLDILGKGRSGWRTDTMGLPVGEINPEADDDANRSSDSMKKTIVVGTQSVMARGEGEIEPCNNSDTMLT